MSIFTLCGPSYADTLGYDRLSTLGATMSYDPSCTIAFGSGLIYALRGFAACTFGFGLILQPSRPSNLSDLGLYSLSFDHAFGYARPSDFLASLLDSLCSIRPSCTAVFSFSRTHRPRGLSCLVASA